MSGAGAFALAVALLAVTALAALSGCKFIDELFGGGEEEAKNKVTGVTVSPRPAYALLGGTRQFSATVSGDDNPAQTVVWTVEGGQHEETTIDEAGLLNVAAEESSRTLTVRAAPTEDPNKPGAVMVTVLNAGSQSIQEKFGIESVEGDEEGKGVSDTFNALHDFIQAGGLSSLPNAIQLGDYIDLDSLTVAAYNEKGAFSETNIHLGEGKGYLLRLIVVGINSFHSGRGVKANGGGATFNGETGGQYTVTVNDGTPHVVFQFQNVPVNRRMEATETSANGYLGSEMRKYLVPTGDEGSGNFLAGLTAAGVPESVLWAPARYIANKGGSADSVPLATGTHTVQDLLWLPTEREIYALYYSLPAWETVENQAWLEYYPTVQQGYVPRKKYNKTVPNDGVAYWLASPTNTEGKFICIVGDGVGYPHMGASGAQGVAPAFCVQ